ncbi:hypothetical protein [Pontivivens insulae]|uniref:Uncharacterized protein n=1 Tax=Pontivivens insulae TaxID=1639689 RepID=A0A2R8A6P9_9RHOB|nr:hypothetical protein [Pontivivens insulae]RED18021.1 hypothetical protein DFR53_0210 [Pontivivens insulae]SPF27914.1 hypothetical protein POI8812_00209 [Pontivivens insulae]
MIARRPALVLLISTCLSPLPLAADSDAAERIMDMSKSEFLEDYENRYMNMLRVSEVMMRRFDPVHADAFDADTPITQAERDGFECTYDAVVAAGAMPAFARYLSASDELLERVEADPSFDYVDMISPEFQTEGDMVPDEAVMGAMLDCDFLTLSQSRLDFTPELWSDIQAAGSERGYF